MTVAEALAELRVHFDRDPVTAEKFRLYVRHLSDIPIDVLYDAVNEIIRTRTALSFPTVGEIRAAAAERILALPTEDAALSQVEARLRARRGGDELPQLHSLVLEAVNLVGGYSAFRSSDSPSVIRGQFLNMYRTLRANSLRGLTVGGHLPELTAGAVAIGAVSDDDASC